MVSYAMSNNRFRNIFLLAITIGIALIIFGWILTPSESVVGVIAAIAILVVYGLTAWFAVKRLEANILSNAIAFGLIAGLIFTSEIILEYILLPKDNTTWGLVEFGSVFLLYFLANLVVSYQTKRIRNGIVSAVGAAMIATLIWTIITLGVFYLFRGTPQQTQIFQAEGNYADFTQSGMTDFNTFIMEDFMGAVFFHSLLGPVIALILGAIGGTTGRIVSTIRQV